MVASRETKHEAGSVQAARPPMSQPQAAPLGIPTVSWARVPLSYRMEAAPGKEWWGGVGGAEGPLPIKGKPTLCRAAPGKRGLREEPWALDSPP